MTAVKWLLENLISEPYSETDFEHNEKCWDKAAEMQKQQIIDALHYFGIENAEQYYNETFKNK
jgi:hypothetical protein